MWLENMRAWTKSSQKFHWDFPTGDSGMPPDGGFDFTESSWAIALKSDALKYGDG